MRQGMRFAEGQQGKSTDALIDALVTDFSAAPAVSLRRTLALGLATGGGISIAAMLATMGLRPDFAAALATFSFWVKLLFPLGLALAGILAMDRLGRPGARADAGFLVGAVVIAAMALLATIELGGAAPSGVRDLLLGHTLDHCTAVILLLSLPILAGGMFAMRAMAPTRLRLAGAAVGVAAGGLSAFIYAYACDETALPFVALWYGAGILLAGALGALLGPRLLRW